ncbi:MAG TPA: hypothetical protein VGB98_07530 [Pyrinomonadaceae bacterium]
MSGGIGNLTGRFAALPLCALLAAGAAAEVWAQGYRVRVYNPGVYDRTRRSMSNRAAARAATRAALKKKKRRVAGASNTPLRRNIN